MYRVFHKLLFGMFSTVWLAKDTVAKDNDETAGPCDHPGASHIVQLRDSFKMRGPNRTHQVLVIDVLASAYWLCTRASDIVRQQSQNVGYQLSLRLDYLQQEEVVHGNLHFDNFGFKVPSIDQCTEEKTLDWIGYPWTTLIVPRDHSARSDSLPKYLHFGLYPEPFEDSESDDDSDVDPDAVWILPTKLPDDRIVMGDPDAGLKTFEDLLRVMLRWTVLRRLIGLSILGFRDLIKQLGFNLKLEFPAREIYNLPAFADGVGFNDKVVLKSELLILGVPPYCMSHNAVGNLGIIMAARGNAKKEKGMVELMLK
ncbi:hypothetical protein K503DRAFT_778437 [Rhizopogon vinicolor AM-OR11-026]|uniref:Uncharacterized protein n=1 Tax=Rhizopogon vinicolor AM-OR11-026 TaxID=1314800 RepID=A0A1B7NI16_9AGAM|nr:hypothetical protein K503DRAFT_778437 [Rhizopogon vinicolor AM-OR11-026]